MKLLKSVLDKIKPHFQKGGRLELFYPIFEMGEDVLFQLPYRTEGGAHLRSAANVKRLMLSVIIAAVPAFLFGIYNSGLQYYTASAQGAGHIDILLKGLQLVLPLYAVIMLCGGAVELVFAVVRRHEISEGFLVTGFLLPLILPTGIPLWQAGTAAIFGVLFGKEVFGGTGMNVFNPALVARAFIFLAYPKSISGDAFQTVVAPEVADTLSTATPLSAAQWAAAHGQELMGVLQEAGYGAWELIAGFVPGSIGETSFIAIILGLIVLTLSGTASLRISLSVFAGGFITALILNAVAPSPAHIFALPAYYHLISGGFAFGAVFMATDPVSAATTRLGKIIYGTLIGVLAVLIRTHNPIYPEGMMFAILIMNAFAPLIDHIIVNENMKRRQRRASA